MMRKHLIAAAASLLLSLGAAAQNDTWNPPLTKDIITIGEREIKLRDAYKITRQPQLFDTVLTSADVVYSVKPAFVKTVFEVSPIQAANLKIVDALSRLYRGYFRGGAGMYTSPLAEVYYNSIRSRTGSFGLHLKHFSSAGGIKNRVSNGAFSENKAQLWGKTFLGKHSLAGEAYFNRNVNHFYGYNPLLLPENEDSYPADSLRQKFLLAGGSARFESYYDDLTKVNHAMEAGYYHYTGLGGSKESNIKAMMNFRKLISNEMIQLAVRLDNNNFAYPDTIKRSGNTILSITPGIVSSGEKYRLKLGLGIFAQFDQTSRFYFFPDAEFSYDLVENVLMPYAGLSGGIERNSLLTTTRTNPFTESAPMLLNTTDKFRFYAGIRGNASASTSFNLMFSHTSRKDMQLFVTDTSGLQNRFRTIYDDAGISTVTGEISYHTTERWELFLKAQYLHYQMEVEKKALNLPSFKGTLGAKLNLASKIYINADLFLEGDRFARVPGISAGGDDLVNLGPVTDMNLGFEYRYTRRLSAFLNFNNIFSKRYQRWYNYHVQGINILGGVTFSF